MLALIEHLIDPLGAMQRIHRLLKPGGFVFIETPNIAKFTRRAKFTPGTVSLDRVAKRRIDDVWGKPGGSPRRRPLALLHVSLTVAHADATLWFLEGGEARAISSDRMVDESFAHKLGDVLSRTWPEFFSEIVVVAYA